MLCQQFEIQKYLTYVGLVAGPVRSQTEFNAWDATTQ
jgi:hypothetical protein